MDQAYLKIIYHIMSSSILCFSYVFFNRTACKYESNIAVEVI